MHSDSGRPSSVPAFAAVLHLKAEKTNAKFTKGEVVVGESCPLSQRFTLCTVLLPFLS